jgi:hypothetical protein
VPQATLANEVSESKRVIEAQIGKECACFVYPNGGPGDVSQEVAQVVRDAGYEFAFTVMGGLASSSDNPMLLDRVFVPAADSGAGFQARISGLHGALKHWLSKEAGSVPRTSGSQKAALPLSDHQGARNSV